MTMNEHEDDYRCLKIHGYIFESEDESDDSKSKTDQLFEKLKPPVIPIDTKTHKVIVINNKDRDISKNKMQDIVQQTPNKQKRRVKKTKLKLETVMKTIGISDMFAFTESDNDEQEKKIVSPLQINFSNKSDVGSCKSGESSTCKYRNLDEEYSYVGTTVSNNTQNTNQQFILITSNKQSHRCKGHKLDNKKIKTNNIKKNKPMRKRKRKSNEPLESNNPGCSNYQVKCEQPEPIKKTTYDKALDKLLDSEGPFVEKVEMNKLSNGENLYSNQRNGVIISENHLIYDRELFCWYFSNRMLFEDLRYTIFPDFDLYGDDLSSTILSDFDLYGDESTCVDLEISKSDRKNGDNLFVITNWRRHNTQSNYPLRRNYLYPLKFILFQVWEDVVRSLCDFVINECF